MNKHIPRNITHIKGKVALAELQRAHFIIFMLAIALAILLLLGTYQPIQFNMALSTAAIILLIIVATASLATTLAMSRLIKK